MFHFLFIYFIKYRYIQPQDFQDFLIVSFVFLFYFASYFVSSNLYTFNHSSIFFSSIFRYFFLELFVLFIIIFSLSLLHSIQLSRQFALLAFFVLSSFGLFLFCFVLRLLFFQLLFQFLCHVLRPLL